MKLAGEDLERERERGRGGVHADLLSFFKSLEKPASESEEGKIGLHKYYRPPFWLLLLLLRDVSIFIDRLHLMENNPFWVAGDTHTLTQVGR